MKKLRNSIIFACMVLLCSLLLFSCGSRLSTPANLELDVDTQTLEWDPVKHASYYTVRITGEKTNEYTTLTPYISLEFLDPGIYNITVMASSTSNAYSNSALAKYPDYEREPETGLKYELINNGKEYMLIGGGNASGDVVMESVFRGKPVTAIAAKALYNNTKITGFTIGENVKTIGEKAFTKCANLVYVTIPEGVTSMGQYAFQSCKALTKVTLPDSITVIPANAFAWCSAISEVKLGCAVTSIEAYAFSNCTVLSKIVYNGMPESDFEINLPKSLKNISEYAFTDCTTFKSITLGGNVEFVGLGAFMNCAALETADLGDSLLALSESAFQECTAIKSISVPDSVEKVGKGCFLGCTSLADVTLGSGVKDIGSSAFRNTKIFNDAIKASETLVISGWLINLVTSGKVYTVPEGVYGVASYAASGNDTVEQINLAGVKYVSEAAFYDCTSLFRVTFDDSLLVLGNAAFYACKNLKTAILGNSLEIVGNYVFYDCEKIGTDKTNVFTIPDTVVSVGTQAFRNTKIFNDVKNAPGGGIVYVGSWVVDFVTGDPYSPTIISDTTKGIANYAFCYQMSIQIYISDSVEYIGKGAFYQSTVMGIRLPSTLKYIGDYAFYGCYATNFGGEKYDLVIPEGTISIGRSAFYECQSILSLTIPGSVKEIGAYAFFNCANIGATYELEITTDQTDEDGMFIKEKRPVQGFITIKDGVVSIGDRAFQNCTEILYLDIPDSVTHIGYRTFYDCNKLISVSIGSGMTKLPNYMFYGCETLESVKLADGVDSIGDHAFRGCTALKNVDLGSVKSIGKYAFYQCAALSVINLPETLTTINDHAFRGCNALKSVIIPSSVTTMGRHVFYGLHNTTIYTSLDSIPDNWDHRFNSSFRPIISGVTLSEDGSYVVAIVKSEANIENSQAANGISDPTREGYDFVGWATEDGATTPEYTSVTVSEAEEGTVLYAIWLISNEDQTEG